MNKELKQLDKELSESEKSILLRKDFQMFGNRFAVDAAAFIREVERAAKSKKTNRVAILVALQP